MKRKNSQVFPLMWRSGIILSTFLLSVGVTIPSPATAASEPILAQASPQERELERLRSEQLQGEASRLFGPTVTLFNILLATLAVLLAGAIAALVLLRRAALREVVDIVTGHFKELGELKEDYQCQSSSS